MIHTVTLKGATSYGSRIPPVPVGRVLRHVPRIVAQAIRMAFQGRSTARGQRPQWLTDMSDVRLVDVSGGDDTVVRFDAPRFGDAPGDLYDQLQLWPTLKPEPENTGFDLLGDILDDIARKDKNSVHFDPMLLKAVGQFDRVIDGEYEELTITTHAAARRGPALVNRDTIETAKTFYRITPAPCRVRIVGTLDMIRASSESFGVRLADGAEIRGVLSAGDIVELGGFLNKDVLVLGEAVFRASGNLLRVDADEVALAQDEAPIWSRAPARPSETMDFGRLRRPQGPRSGIAAIIGRWPGDETDEQVRAALEELS